MNTRNIAIEIFGNSSDRTSAADYKSRSELYPKGTYVIGLDLFGFPIEGEISCDKDGFLMISTKGDDRYRRDTHQVSLIGLRKIEEAQITLIKFDEHFQDFRRSRIILEKLDAEEIIEGFFDVWEPYADKCDLLKVYHYPSDYFIFEVLIATTGDILFITPGYVEVITHDFNLAEMELFEQFKADTTDFTMSTNPN